MRRILLLSAMVATLVCMSHISLLAQGHGQGASRAMGALNRSGASSGNSQAMQSLSRASRGTGRMGAGLGHATNGLQRANSAVAHVPDSAPPSRGVDPNSNPQRILDNRLSRAEHLREVSAQNNNERLLDTADRMEASAQQNYSRQTNSTAPTEPSTVTDAAVSTGRVNPAARGFWFRSR